MIRNRNNKSLSENQIPSNLSLHQFGQAMAQLDTSNIPPEKRPYAIRAHVLKILAMTTSDRQLGQDIASSYMAALTQRGIV